MKTAYIELNTTNQIRNLSRNSDKPSFRYKGIVFYPNTTVTSLPEILHEDYRYFVLDMGVLNTYTTNEFLRCDKPFLVCSPREWRYSQIEEKTEKLFKNLQNQNCIRVLLNLCEKESKSFVFSRNCERISFPYIENPFQIEPSHFHVISRILNTL